MSTRRASRGTGAAAKGDRFERKRREVLDAAIELFAEKGYDGASLLDIADAVGLLKGSLYYYARSKEELLLAIVEDVFDEGTSAAEAVRASSGTPPERLRASLVRAATYMLTHRQQAAVYFRDAKALSEERRAELAPRRTAWVRSLTDLLCTGQKSGHFRDDVDPRVAVVPLIGAINWLAIQADDDTPARSSRAKFVEAYCEQLLRSVMVDPQPE